MCTLDQYPEASQAVEQQCYGTQVTCVWIPAIACLRHQCVHIYIYNEVVHVPANNASSSIDPNNTVKVVSVYITGHRAWLLHHCTDLLTLQTLINDEPNQEFLIEFYLQQNRKDPLRNNYHVNTAQTFELY